MTRDEVSKRISERLRVLWYAKDNIDPILLADYLEDSLNEIRQVPNSEWTGDQNPKSADVGIGLIENSSANTLVDLRSGNNLDVRIFQGYVDLAGLFNIVLERG